MHEVMNMEKSNPYSFYVVLADGIMEIPQDSNLSWITLFYALPKELVEKRPAYLEFPRNIHQLLHSEEYRKLIESEAFLELVWDCYAWAAWQHHLPENLRRVTEICVGFRHDKKNERSAKSLEISRLGGF